MGGSALSSPEQSGEGLVAEGSLQVVIGVWLSNSHPPWSPQPPVNMRMGSREGQASQDKMRVRDVWLGFERPRSCRAFSCMKSWSLVPPQATVFQALVIWEQAKELAPRWGKHAACLWRSWGHVYDPPSL